MSIRYLSNLVLALIAGFLVVATQAFGLPAVKWLSFAIAIGATALSLGTAGFRVGLVQRAISAVAAVIGIWTIVESQVFSLHTVMWLGFASAVALVGLAVVGLMVHEFSTERVVHSLEIEHEGPARRRDPLAA
jgi:hypothetical protein